MHQLGPRLLLGLFGVALMAGGWAIAANFRGFTVWHARLSVSVFREPTEERVARQSALERFIGGVFAAAGAIAFIASFLVHFHTS